jgi:hypothetical protein
VYIDDFFICHASEHLAIKSRNFLLHTLIRCGWLLSVPKHQPVSQKKVFLGLTINSLSMKFEIPDEKLSRFFEVLIMVKSQEVMPVRLLAQLLGLLNSFSRALGQIVRLMTRSLYACLKPAYFSEERWAASTSLSELAKDELRFWESNITKLNGFAISPVIPSITTCEVIAGDASGEGLYAAHFSGVQNTVYSRKLTLHEKSQSSTFRECLVILGIYTNSNSPIGSFKGRKILHLTDNKGVVSVFTIGSPKPALQEMAVKVFRVANSLGLKLFFVWKSRNDPTMQLVDKGSRGPWSDFDDFSLDDPTIAIVLSRGVNLDGFASFHNKIVDRYISLGFQVEAIGTDFFTQTFQSTDIILIHPHPLMLFDALTHASHFKCKVVVVMHIWEGYPPYKNFLRGGHLPSFCHNITLVNIDFKASSPAPAFTGIRNFSSCIFDIHFTGDLLLPDWLLAEDSQQGVCVLGGCYVCDSSLQCQT